jgi:signal transduction histidine kinase
VRIAAAKADGGVRVAVADTGPGIPRELHEKIFEKFAQAGNEGFRKRHSSGIGLTFCRLAVEAHGGMIGIESDEGKGSTFWFTIPA